MSSPTIFSPNRTSRLAVSGSRIEKMSAAETRKVKLSTNTPALGPSSSGANTPTIRPTTGRSEASRARTAHSNTARTAPDATSPKNIADCWVVYTSPLAAATSCSSFTRCGISALRAGRKNRAAISVMNTTR